MEAATVTWDEEVDDVLGGDLTAGLAYVTPAGGAVVTAVAPVGLRDREAGVVSFTTSFGFAQPRNGTGPRVDAARAARRLARLPHRLLAFWGADGFPVVLPFTLGEAGDDGLRVRVGGGPLPAGGRRAGLLAHHYRPQLVGLATRQHTGWLEAGTGGSEAVYAPHTETGFRAPANKTLLLLANGFLAKRNIRRAKGPLHRQRGASREPHRPRHPRG